MRRDEILSLLERGLVDCPQSAFLKRESRAAAPRVTPRRFIEEVCSCCSHCNRHGLMRRAHRSIQSSAGEGPGPGG